MGENIQMLILFENRMHGTIPSAIGELQNLIALDIRGNLLSGVIPETIGKLSHISELWLSDNKLSGRIPSAMQDLQSLRYLFLDSNTFTQIHTDAFSGLRLNVLDLGNQSMSLSPLELEPGAFRNCTNGNNALISLAPNYIPKIPAYAFQGLASNVLDLSQLGITSIEDNAFADTTIESLVLYQNNVVQMSSRAFEQSTNRSADCVDFEGWQMNDTLLNRTFTCDNFASKSYFSFRQSLTTPGSCGYTYLRACCNAGGGHTYGLNVQMDYHSSVTCRVEDNVAKIKCGCGTLNWRFDTRLDQCVGFCPAGRKWMTDDDNNGKSILRSTMSGRCVKCAKGKKSLSSDFSTSCESCEVGRFSSNPGSTSCMECSKNMYADQENSTKCKECVWGKHAPHDASASCSNCYWTYLGSPNCDVPVLGTILLFTIVIVVMISIVYGVRHTRSLRGKLKNSLAELESYSEDVKLLAAAWELQWNQIKLGPEVARGGGGVVRGV